MKENIIQKLDDLLARGYNKYCCVKQIMQEYKLSSEDEKVLLLYIKGKPNQL